MAETRADNTRVGDTEVAETRAEDTRAEDIREVFSQKVEHEGGTHDTLFNIDSYRHKLK